MQSDDGSDPVRGVELVREMMQAYPREDTGKRGGDPAPPMSGAM
jgi:hypothetical protein